MAGGRVSRTNEKENTQLKRLVADLSLSAGAEKIAPGNL